MPSLACPTLLSTPIPLGVDNTSSVSIIPVAAVVVVFITPPHSECPQPSAPSP